MDARLPAFLSCLILSAPALGGCGATAYTPRPSPRIQVVPDGSSLVLVKNGRRHPFNMFGSNLDEVVQGNPQAEAEASSYRTKTITGFVFSTLGTVSAGVGAAVLVGNEVRASPSTDLRIGSLAMAFGGLALSIVGSVIVAGAQPHLWNAINIYNDGLPAYPTYPTYPAWPQQPAPTTYPGYPAAGPAPHPSPAPAPTTAPLPSSAVPLPGPAPAPSAPTPPAAPPPPTGAPSAPPAAPPPR